jgi:hypothetical protein
MTPSATPTWWDRITDCIRVIIAGGDPIGLYSEGEIRRARERFERGDFDLGIPDLSRLRPYRGPSGEHRCTECGRPVERGVDRCGGCVAALVWGSPGEGR